MKRILVVSEVFWPENFLINDLVKEWEHQGYHIEVLTQWPSYPEGKIYPGYKNSEYAQEKWGEIVIHRFKFIEGYKESKLKKILNYRAFVTKGKKILTKIGCNFDHIFVHQTGPLTQGLPAVWFSRKYNIPLTIWTLDLWPDTLFAYGIPKIKPIEIYVNNIIRKVYSNSSQIFVSSRAFAETINSYVPDKKIEYIPNWLIPTENKISSLQLSRDKFNFTFTGNISISQNVENLIKGFIRAGITNSQFNIVGNGSSISSLKSIVKKDGINNVIFHGRFPFEEMGDIMNQSDVLVMSLLSKGGVDKTEPFKLQSYLMAGKPILGAMGGGGKEIIETENIGVCCSADDIDDIALAFNKAYNLTDEQREEIAINAKNTQKTRFNREIIISNINQLLNSL